MARIPKEYRFTLILSLVLHVLFLVGFVAMTMAEKPARLEKPVDTRVTVAIQETSTSAPSPPEQESKPEPTRPPVTEPPRSTAPPKTQQPVEKPRATPKPEPTPNPKPTSTPRPKATEKPKATPVPTTAKPTTAKPKTAKPTTAPPTTIRATTAPPTTTARNQPTVEELRRRMKEKGVKSPSRDYPDPNKSKSTPAPTARTPDRSSANNSSPNPTKVDNTSASWNHVGLPDYYAQSALNKVSRLFRVPPSEQRAVVALLSVRIDRSGNLSNIRVAKSSGDATLDAYAVKALEAAKSFPPLPDSFPRNNVEVEISFSFVQD